MNAHTPITIDREAFRALDDLEAELDRIKQLASAAFDVVEVNLGNEVPASRLRALLSLIEDLVDKAEGQRASAQGALQLGGDYRGG